ncbi:FAD-binding oxidoreductase [soil metagenome]
MLSDMETDRRHPRALQADVAGQLVLPGDEQYDTARRVWNGMIDRRPAAIVQAASASDIAPVLRFARENGFPLAIRGGGHGVAGNGTVDDGIVLDLGALKQVEVDSAQATVRVGAGATLADVDVATEGAGLIVPIGVVSATGLAGLTLGGGFGWLTRPFGLSIDNLLSVELVTAEGEYVTASESEHTELFWGLRGGGGNFGVATSLTFRAQRLGPQVFAGNVIYRRDKWAAALRSYAAWTADLPDELNSIATFMVPLPSWEMGDDTLLFIGFTWVGEDESEAQSIIAKLRSAVTPDIVAAEPSRWVEWQAQADELFPRGSRAYWKNVAFDELNETAVATVVDAASRLAMGSAADIHHMQGAFGRVPEDATAFPNRSARYWLNIYGFWQDAHEDEDRIAWVRGCHAGMAPLARPGQYVNFLGNEGSAADPREMALAAYGRDKFERLVQIKRRYDPTNLFRLNHNIPPD